ncbi:hypothetical protein [Nannocystis punicea]|uniref:Uncharacterized protein n=1 Tax=Nannocystis punicea TaxID=2995304 RepID=A0ABY7GUR1_9BACT|nr:hypothetical protein [Nannocystis poenicansa]WAS90670.1 hypothetical protein O0S08_31165 [Nannocystis poenicansa]
MFRSSIAAVTAGISLGGLPLAPNQAAASPYLVDLAARSDPPAGDESTHTHEVLEALPTPPAPRIAIDTPAVQVPVAAAPHPISPASTAFFVGAPRSVPRPPDLAPAPAGGLGLMITGFSMFTVSYLLTAWAGSIVQDGQSACDGTREQCREIGKALRIPFAGPIMAARELDGTQEILGLVLVSGAQIATFTMGLVGAVRQLRYKRWERNLGGIPLGESGLAVQPMPRRDGGGLGLNYRF